MLNQRMGYLAQGVLKQVLKRGLSTDCFHPLICFCCAEFLSNTDVANEDLYLGPGFYSLYSLQLTLCSQTIICPTAGLFSFVISVLVSRLLSEPAENSGDLVWV